MMRLMVVCAVGLALAGCKSSQEMAAQAAAQDDATCRSYGAAPGSDAYVQCRMMQGQQRSAAAAQDAITYRNMTSNGLAMMQPRVAPRLQANCTTTQTGTIVNTNCY